MLKSINNTQSITKHLLLYLFLSKITCKVKLNNFKINNVLQVHQYTYFLRYKVSNLVYMKQFSLRGNYGWLGKKN